MSEFSKLTENEDHVKPRRGLPSALQIAWALVIVVFGGTLLWLGLSPELPATQAGITAPAPKALAKTAPPAPTNMAAGNPLAPPAPPPASTQPTTPQASPAAPAVTAAPTASPTFTGLAPELPLPPDSKLAADSKYGPLPVIAADGRQPWQAYAHKFNDPAGRPRIAIVISDLGLSSLVTTLAVEKLPAAVTLAFTPYGDKLAGWAAKARAAGHETMVVVPMEPQSYPQDDPGPRGLMTGLSPDENIDRLHWAMTRFAGYVGIINDMGSKFMASENDMRTVIQDIQKRGIMFVDSHSSRFTVGARLAHAAGVPYAINNRYIDNSLAAGEIDRNLVELETNARQSGVALGVGHAYPVTIDRVRHWAKGLEARGFVLVPITAIANRQSVN